MALRTGLLILPAHDPARLADLAALAEDTGYDDFWLADERFFREVYACLALCAVRTHRIRLGPCVTDPYSRHPALTATAMATLDGISNQRAVLGLGAGVSGFRELGVDTSRSAVAIREAVELIRRLLAGETVTVQGRVISFTDGRLDFAPRRPAHLRRFAAGGGMPSGGAGSGRRHHAGCSGGPPRAILPRDRPPRSPAGGARSRPRGTGGATQRLRRRRPSGRPQCHAPDHRAKPQRATTGLLHLCYCGLEAVGRASGEGARAALHARSRAASRGGS